MTNLGNKISGALYGVAAGDALGAPLEFMSAAEITRKYGSAVKDMIGGGWLNVEPGEVTDDTQMTIAAALAIAMHPEEPEPYAGQYFAEWAMGGPKDIGGTCRSAITNALQMMTQRPELKDCKGLAPYDLWARASQLTAEQNGHRSAGNGALMRTVYPGLYYPDRDRAADVADRIGLLTHWDDLSREACVLYTDMLHLITSSNKPTAELWDDAEKCLEGTKYQKVHQREVKPSGFVVDSFKCALWCIRNTKSFESALIKAVNLGGDADTIGAITGGLAGALYGYDAIPVRWRVMLDRKTRLTLSQLAGDAIISRQAGE